MQRGLRNAAALALVVATVGACGFLQSPDLTLSYRVFGEPTNIDQVLGISNPRTDQAAIPTIEVVPRDGQDNGLPGVSTESLFGVTDGKVLIPPGGGYDILSFSGD